MLQRLKAWWRGRKLQQSMKSNPRFASMQVGERRTRFTVGDSGPLMTNPGVNVTITNDPLETAQLMPPPDERPEVKPVDVIHEIESEQEEDFSLDDLDEKLEILEERALLYSETLGRGVPEDLFHAIEVLKARKKYPKVAQHIPWKTTTQEKIDALCKTYKLRHGPISLFLPEFPDDVLEEIKGESRFQYSTQTGSVDHRPSRSVQGRAEGGSHSPGEESVR
jgi:hypothetical protein